MDYLADIKKGKTLNLADIKKGKTLKITTKNYHAPAGKRTMHSAESEADAQVLKKCFKTKYDTFSYAYFSPDGGTDVYTKNKTEAHQGKNTIVGHLEYYGEKDGKYTHVADVFIEAQDLDGDLKLLEDTNSYTVIPAMDPDPASILKGVDLKTLFKKQEKDGKLLPTTIDLPIEGEVDGVQCVLLKGAEYHWVSEGGWVYKKGEVYYYLGLSKDGWERTQDELEEYLDGYAVKCVVGGGRKRRRKTKRKRTKRRKTKRKRTKRGKTKRKKRRGRKKTRR